MDAEVVGRIVSSLFSLFDEPVFHSHTLDSASYMAMIAIKELEERYPLSTILYEINTHFVLRTVQNFYRFKNSELGPSSKEFLDYLARYRPHLHPLIDLVSAGIL